jgi:hypothetical protein
MKVLCQIRGKDGPANKTVKFVWAIELDEDRAALEAKILKRNFAKIARCLALDQRAFGTQITCLTSTYADVCGHVLTYAGVCNFAKNARCLALDQSAFGTHFTCYSSTKAQVLTPEELRACQARI